MSASTLLSRRRYRLMMAVSKDTPLSRGHMERDVTGGRGAVIMAAVVALTSSRCVRGGQPCVSDSPFQQFVSDFSTLLRTNF